MTVPPSPEVWRFQFYDLCEKARQAPTIHDEGAVYAEVVELFRELPPELSADEAEKFGAVVLDYGNRLIRDAYQQQRRV